jgi:starvation-inducible outer membrane lipoprotein
MKKGFYLMVFALMVAGCTRTPQPGTQCSTKILTPEEMAKTATNTHWQ